MRTWKGNSKSLLDLARNQFVKILERQVERNGDESRVGVGRQVVARRAHLGRASQHLEVSVRAIISELRDERRVRPVNLEVPVLVAIPHMDLLDAPFARNVKLQKNLTVVRGAHCFLILDGIEVPVGEEHVRIARHQKQLARAIGFGQVAQKFIRGQRKGRSVFFNAWRGRSHRRLRFTPR
jgi:hypothetical protein